jgi:hypothetical protein
MIIGRFDLISTLKILILEMTLVRIIFAIRLAAPIFQLYWQPKQIKLKLESCGTPPVLAIGHRKFWAPI